jgi:hypothetical protein
VIEDGGIMPRTVEAYSPKDEKLGRLAADDVSANTMGATGSSSSTNSGARRHHGLDHCTVTGGGGGDERADSSLRYSVKEG